MTPELPAIGSMVDVQMTMRVTAIHIEDGVTKVLGTVKYADGDYDYMGSIAPLVCCEVIDRQKQFERITE